MRKLITALMLITALEAGAQQDTASLAQELKYAEYMAANGRQALAFESINGIISAHPSCSRAYYIRSTCHLGDGNTKAALQDIETALRHSPANAEYLLRKSAVLLAMGKAEMAASPLYRALESHPEVIGSADPEKLVAAEIMVLNHNTIDALPIINSIENKDSRFLRVRGMAYTESDMYDMAIKDLSNALDLNPALSSCHTWLGIAKYRQGQKAEARRCWETAVKKGDLSARNYLNKYK